MNGSSFLNKKVLGAFVLVLLLGAGGLAWMERTPLLACYCVHNLARAKEADRAVWVNRVVSIGEPTLGDLLDCLNDPADDCCGNAHAALEKLTAEWGPGDARTVSLALRCGREFPHMSAAGRRNVLELAVGWFPPTPNEGSNTAGLVPPCSRLLAEAVATKDAVVQGRRMSSNSSRSPPIASTTGTSIPSVSDSMRSRNARPSGENPSPSIQPFNRIPSIAASICAAVQPRVAE